MIELKEWNYNLLRRIEKANSTDYGIVEIRGNYYIEPDDLFVLIDDIQDYRDNAEQKISELYEKIDTKNDIPGLEQSLQNEVIRLKKENAKLQKNLEIIQGTWNEDDYDKVLEEGFEL
jgi:hypothetical protein